jgi:NTP pyrophosphatase (non-canonical NTP hydrolase)
MKRLGGRKAAKDGGCAGWRSLQEDVLRFRDARDWKQFHNPKDLAAAVAIEAGELQEHFLWRTPAEIEASLREPGRLRAAHDELADVLICALLCADALDADVEQIVRAKLRRNAVKYPVRMAKGTSRKYTELDGR